MQTYSKNKDCKHKIEDNSNKYTFIWKKKVNKFYEKLKIKINNFCIHLMKITILNLMIFMK